mmetsp:Transcript_4600/g.4321  ORF Transcript_4600/g.4321 Transcript_4600/m.4321 type:complete len:196 (-) Transcript_4600:915-1502(-)
MPPSKVFFTVTQMNPRFMPANLHYDLGFVKILLGKLQGDKVEFIKGTCSNYIDVTLEPDQNLDQGSYMMLVEIQWGQERIRDFVVSVYSQSAQVSFHLLPEEDGSPTNPYKDDKFLREILSSSAKQSYAKVPQKRQSYAEKDEPNIYKTSSIGDAVAEYGYVFFENESKNGATLLETAQINENHNQQFLLPSDVS